MSDTSVNCSNKEFVNYSVVILKIMLINIILPYCLLTKPLQTEILTTSFFFLQPTFQQTLISLPLASVVEAIGIV